MESLDTQQQFEALWFNELDPKPWIVYFTAAWCGPCKRLDLDAIQAAAKDKGIRIYKCDASINEYTSGYCGVRAFPTFLCMKPRAVLKTLKSSNTVDVVEWIRTMS
jgi:thioredoxin-like negative regulator of GroEL